MIYVTLAALVVLAVVPIYLAYAQYNDGVVGRIALAAMSLASIGELMLFWSRGDPIAAGGTGELLLIASAVFMARHALRYWQWSRYGRCGWSDRDCEAESPATVVPQHGTPTEEEERPIPYFLQRDKKRSPS